MGSDKVIVVLTEGEAEWFTTPGNEGSTAASKYVRYAVRAALDRDRDELVSEVATALYRAGVKFEGNFSERVEHAKEAASYVLAAIEGADHDE